METKYLTYEMLLALHVHLMRDEMQETYYGVGNPGLLMSALSRPLNAASYENADLIKQGAYLFQGLLMNHGFLQGNKRTAFYSLLWFFNYNGVGSIEARPDEIVGMCVSAENQKWSVEKIDEWLRKYLAK